MKRGHTILTDSEKRFAIDMWNKGYSYTAIAEVLYCCPKTIERTCKGKRNRHKLSRRDFDEWMEKNG